MAVDITLVLASEHRRLRQLIDRCGRSSRGFHDPVKELQNALRAHVLAASAEVYPTAATLGSPSDWPAEDLVRVRQLAESARPTRSELVRAAGTLIDAEQHVLAVLPSLELTDRRRLGKVFRIRRDSLLRGVVAGSRRRRSQTELYELARRAGVEHRSRMTQVQLQAAIEARSVGG
jgi:hypothetical protein